MGGGLAQWPKTLEAKPSRVIAGLQGWLLRHWSLLPTCRASLFRPAQDVGLRGSVDLGGWLRDDTEMVCPLEDGHSSQ